MMVCIIPIVYEYYLMLASSEDDLKDRLLNSTPTDLIDDVLSIHEDYSVKTWRVALLVNDREYARLKLINGEVMLLVDGRYIDGMLPLL